MNHTSLPTLRWMLASPARWLALGLGSGLLKPGPGTWGTALAWLLWWAGLSHLSDHVIALLLAGGFVLGCRVCQRVGQELGKADHGSMVWDEMLAFWLLLWLIPGTMVMQGAAFVLFRAFDIVKPFPIGWFDARFKNGLGVMWDDVLAAAWAWLLISLWLRWSPLPW